MNQIPSEVIKKIIKLNQKNAVEVVFEILLATKQYPVEDLYEIYKRVTQNQIKLATVYIPKKIKLETEEKLKLILQEKLNKEVIVDYIIDKSLLGGMRIEIDDKVLDHSLFNFIVNL